MTVKDTSSMRNMISVCMATYNGERHIAEQLSSIISQISEYDEIVIVDDCSSDFTLEIVRGFDDPRIRIFRNSKNLGVIRTFEKAIEESIGDLIFLSDQDDVWMPCKVQTSLEIFDGQHADLILADAYILVDGSVQLDTFFEFRRSSLGFTRNFFKNSFVGCCMSFRSSMKDYFLPFPDIISMHDFWIGEIISVFGSVVKTDERMILYRRHENNVTDMSRSSIPKIVVMRFKNFYALFIRIVGIKFL
ncbi:glycosyltransferase [Deinococcus detaillensis]|nr:glycosyltransferase [Deinococcus detaillensis]